MELEFEDYLRVGNFLFFLSSRPSISYYYERCKRYG
jgi:hypothetical protein